MKGIQQEETERTEKIDLKAPFFPGEHRMHPLFEKASALTETIIAAAIEVHRDKGPGLIESIYEWCLMKELELRSVKCVSQRVVVVEYKEFTREEPLRFDLLVEGCVLVEAKAVEKILPIHSAQLLSYMKLLNVPLGLLINFHEVKATDGIRRMILPGANQRKTRFKGRKTEIAENCSSVFSVSSCSHSRTAGQSSA
jgi:GxxExxY protein